MKPFARFAAAIITGIPLMILALISCDKGNLPPVAKMTTFPAFGDTSILFEFNAGESDDDRNYAVALQYRWDFETDRSGTDR